MGVRKWGSEFSIGSEFSTVTLRVRFKEGADFLNRILKQICGLSSFCDLLFILFSSSITFYVVSIFPRTKVQLYPCETEGCIEELTKVSDADIMVRCGYK